MNISDRLVSFLKNLSLTEAFFLFWMENVLLWLMALSFGWLLVRLYRKRPVSNSYGQFSVNIKKELILSFITIFINTLITLAGFLLWKKGVIIILPFEGGLRDLLDVLILVLSIDMAMYLLHRMAHLKLFYSFMHRLHHEFEEPTSVTLFSLHPFETISFGILWLSILSLYNASIVGIVVYLTLNVLFGIIGHCGVEPVPASWSANPVLKYIANGSFHVTHHRESERNFGFYTNIWDRLMGTYSPKNKI